MVKRINRWCRPHNLQCVVLKLEYNFQERSGEIHFPGNHHCDARACIDLFKSIDPEVKVIQTYNKSGKKKDIKYVFGVGDSDSWTCYGCE